MTIHSLHNHTPFSDGVYTIDEICDAHLSLSDCVVDTIGISDSLFRTPTSRECRDDQEFVRVFERETRRYVAEAGAARARWAGRVNLCIGCEINWPLNKAHLPAIRSLLSGIDYVMFEYCDWAGLTTLANQARHFPCPVGLANTRPAERMPNTSFDQVVRTLANARIFYEVSAHFLPLSERDPWFSVLPQHRVPISLGLDLQDDLDAVRLLPRLADYAGRRGLTDRLIAPSRRGELAAAS